MSAVRQVAYGQGTLASAAVPQGVEVTLRGVEPGGEQLGGTQVELAPGPDGVPRALLGAELAAALRAAPDEVLRLAALGLRDGRPRFVYQSVRFAGTFTTGFSEFDRGWVVVDRPLVERLLGGQASADLYEIRAEDPAAAPSIGAAARQILGDRFLVTDWQELNRDLFVALRVQQRALFLVLGLIVLVSTFNVASTVVVLVRERMREIGALAAMGLPASAHARRLPLLRRPARTGRHSRSGRPPESPPPGPSTASSSSASDRKSRRSTSSARCLSASSSATWWRYAGSRCWSISWPVPLRRCAPRASIQRRRCVTSER